MRGVEVTLIDITSGVTLTARTNQLGLFCFQNLTSGSTYTVTALPNSRFQIINNVRTISAANNATGVDFIADTLSH